MRRPFLCLLVVTLGAAIASAGQPVAVSVTPDTVRPYESVVLRVEGSGFGPGCRALLGRAGRYVPVATTVEGGTVVEIRLPAGLPPVPRERAVVVECGSTRTAPLTVTVNRSMPGGAQPVPSPSLAAAAGAASAAEPEPATAAVPVLARLDPWTVPAGEPFTLTLTGSRFEEGASVEVTVNVNAGTSRPPEYRPRRFPADRLSDTVLLVDFDRGFAPEPPLRPVRVVNRSGAQSAPLYLRISGRTP